MFLPARAGAAEPRLQSFQAVVHPFSCSERGFLVVQNRHFERPKQALLPSKNGTFTSVLASGCVPTTCKRAFDRLFLVK